MKGVPIRLAIGPRDLENNAVELARRDTLEKESSLVEGLAEKITNLLKIIQKNLYQKALDFREANTHHVNTWDEFKDVIGNKGGFAIAFWDGTPETEQKIKEKTKATIRFIPLENNEIEGKCIYSGKPTKQKVYFAKAY